MRDGAAIEEVIARAPVCRLALSDNGEPYVVPMNFGYSDGVLYFHGAPNGRKIDIIGMRTVFSRYRTRRSGVLR